MKTEFRGVPAPSTYLQTVEKSEVCTDHHGVYPFAVVGKRLNYVVYLFNDRCGNTSKYILTGNTYLHVW